MIIVFIFYYNITHDFLFIWHRKCCPLLYTLGARLAEYELIKKLQPMFNSQYKNHKKYIYLKVEDYNVHNSLSISYEKADKCYGPFKSMSFIMNSINSLKNIYPIVKTNDEYCFQFNLIPSKMDKEKFNLNRDNLIEIFSKYEMLILFINKLEEKMKESSLLLKFETASYYKNLIHSINYIRRNKFNYIEMVKREIILKLPIEGGYKLFYISNGSIVLKEKHTELEKEVIDYFIRKSKSITLTPNDLDEKYNIDFQEILYSEIKSLPEENVIISHDSKGDG